MGLDSQYQEEKAGVVYAFVINAAVSLAGCLCLLLIWHMDRAQDFVRSMALAQLGNFATVLFFLAWKRGTLTKGNVADDGLGGLRSSAPFPKPTAA